MLGDNIFERSQAAAIAAVGVPAATGAMIFVKDVPDPENFGVVVYDEDGRVVDIVEKAGVVDMRYDAPPTERRRRRALLLPAGRLRRDRARSSRPRAASSRSPTSTATTRSRDGSTSSRSRAGGRTQASTGSTSPRSAASSSETGANG